MKQKFASLLLIGLIAINFPIPKMPKNATAPGLQRLLEKRLEKFTGKRAVITTGKVVAKEGTTLTIIRDGENYTVLTDEKTQFRRKFWGKSSLEEISVGDLVNIIGKWTSEEKTEIRAILIRNLSVQKRRGVFFGKIKSVSGSGFVMETAKKSELAVTIEASTKLVNRKMEVITLADIKVGHRVRVRGLWDSTKKTITEVKQVKDFSIPVIPSPSPEVE